MSNEQVRNAARDAVAEVLEKERDAATREATQLAVWLHRNFYADVTQWRPLGDPAGVISQIDNMVAGIAEKLRTAEADASALRAKLDREADALGPMLGEYDAWSFSADTISQARDILAEITQGGMKL
jgi:hypothetical protein